MEHTSRSRPPNHSICTSTSRRERKLSALRTRLLLEISFICFKNLTTTSAMVFFSIPNKSGLDGSKSVLAQAFNWDWVMSTGKLRHYSGIYLYPQTYQLWRGGKNKYLNIHPQLFRFQSFLYGDSARKRIWNSPSVIWIKDFRIFTIIPVIEKDLFGRSSYYQVSDRFIKSLKVTHLRIIPWPDHFHLVLFWRVRRHVLRSVWRFYNLS